MIAGRLACDSPKYRDQSTHSNVTLAPFTAPGAPGRMIARLELVGLFAGFSKARTQKTEEVDGSRNLRLGVGRACFPERDRPYGLIPIAPD